MELSKEIMKVWKADDPAHIYPHKTSKHILYAVKRQPVYTCFRLMHAYYLTAARLPTLLLSYLFILRPLYMYRALQGKSLMFNYQWIFREGAQTSSGKLSPRYWPPFYRQQQPTAFAN